MPPPAATEVSFVQLTLEPDDELDGELDEQPVASRATAAKPASANLYGDLTSASRKLSPSRSGSRPSVDRRAAAPRRVYRPHLAPKLRVLDKRI
jgi:hypothetical protein